ncbi:MAG: tRNA (adenosine(37)-N6)-threonylcarbamoyltransferase complex transferase subunit TsaD [Phycisphaeraceae bacterium]
MTPAPATHILGIETSCDETAAAVVADGRQVLSNVVASQHELHAPYRGVVPEIASRAHVERIEPVVRQALADAGLAAADLDAVAVGNRPGLIGSLLVGVSAAQALAWALGRPLIGVDHVHAHLHAANLTAPPTSAVAAPADAGPERVPPTTSTTSPALGLVVSGGHTSLYLIHSPTNLQPLGRTIDDAVGEAYDKAAVILDAGYPGGPRLDALAQRGDPGAHKLPRSMLEPDSLDFSFSGLKTALLYAVRGHPVGRGRDARFPRAAADLTDPQRADFAAAFQLAVVDVLIAKIERALDLLAQQATPVQHLVAGGGVTANSLLRHRLHQLGDARSLRVDIPHLAYCLDNAAMIAGLAHARFAAGEADTLDLPALPTTTT